MNVFSFVLIGCFLLMSSPSVNGQTTSQELPPGVTMEMVRKGGALFQGRGLCVNCHGAAATGLIGPDLTDSDWLQVKGSYLSILQVILNGIPVEASSRNIAMPARGGAPINDVEIQSVAAYVWQLSHLNDPKPPGVSLKMMEEGKVIFSGKGACVKCHGGDAHGDIGPDLTDSEWLQAKGSYLEIINTINTGVSTEQSTRGVPMPPRGGANLNPEEVHNVGAYVWYLSHQN